MKESFIRRCVNFYRSRKISQWAIFYFLVYVIFIIKLITFQELDEGWFFGIYGIAVSFYILSRFALAYLYEPEESRFDRTYQPTLSFAVPSKNEEENIFETVMRIAATDYPKHKFDIIAVNDGSTDGTLAEMLRAKKAAAALGIQVNVIDWKENRGKREGMAECIRQSGNEILVFIDSDSFVRPDTAKELIKYFCDPKVAAAAGHAYVANAEKNILTKMQAVRYYVAFRAYKGAESLFGAVTCCSGCCAAYRKEVILPFLDEWANQTFLGVRCTYGDDRSLTNAVLKRGYRAVFAPEAVSYTFAPDNFRQFMKQQFRWKKSWFRESFLASFFMWKQNPVASLSFYAGFALPLVSPVIVLRALIWYPYAYGKIPYSYLAGLAFMAVVYGFYYYIHTKDRKWAYGVLFATFYALVLMWQLPWAIMHLRDSRWGTR